jgi:hypothetical protein
MGNGTQVSGTALARMGTRHTHQVGHEAMGQLSIIPLLQDLERVMGQGLEIADREVGSEAAARTDHPKWCKRAGVDEIPNEAKRRAARRMSSTAWNTRNRAFARDME